MKRPFWRRPLTLLLVGGGLVAVLAIVWQLSHARARDGRRSAAIGAVGDIARRAVYTYEREPTCTGMIAAEERAYCADPSVPVETRLRKCLPCSLPSELMHHLCLSARPGDDGVGTAGKAGESVDIGGIGDAGVVGWKCLGHSGKAPEGIVLEYVAEMQPDGGGWFEARAIGDFEDHEPLDRYVVRGEIRTERRYVTIGEATYETVP